MTETSSISELRSEVQILNELLAAQSICYIFKDTKKIADFISKMIKSVPGIEKCCLGIRNQNQIIGDNIPSANIGFEQLMKISDEQNQLNLQMLHQNEIYHNTKVYLIKTMQREFGFVVVSINNLHLFSNFDAAINNFINTFAVQLESQWHNELLERYEKQLEQLVEQRTKELSSEVEIRKQKEVELERNQKLLGITERFSKVGGWEIDVVNDKVHFTDETYRIYDLDKSFDIDNISALDYYDEESGIKITNALTDALDGGKSWDMELRFITAKGEKKWVRTIGEPFFDEAGNTIKIIGNLMDLTDYKKTIDLVRENKERFKKTFNESPVGSVIVGLDKKFINCNKAFADFLHYSREEIIGKNVDDVTYFEDMNLGNDILKALINNQLENGTIEKRYLTKNNEIVWGELSVTLVRDENHKPLYFLPIIVDITKRKINEEIDNFRLELVDKSVYMTLDEIMQISIDKAESLTNSSIGFFHFVDDDQENLTLQIWSSYTLNNMCTAEGKGSHYEISKAGVWVDAFYQKKPVIHNDYSSLENKKGIPDGHAKVIRELVVPVIRGNKIIAIFGVGNKKTDYIDNDISTVDKLASFVMNIVERRRAEDALKVANDYNRNLIEVSVDPLVTIGSDGKVNDVNFATEKITGVTRDELIGTDFSDYFTQPNKAKAGYQLVFKEGQVVDYPLEIKHINGKITPVLYNATIFKNIDGQIKGVFAAARDITELKKKEEEIQKKNSELIQLNATRNKFFSILAHDLRSPFSGLVGISDILENEYDYLTKPELMELISALNSTTHTTFNLLNDLLDWARFQIGSIPFKPKENNISQIIKEIVTLLENSAMLKNIIIINTMINDLICFCDNYMVSTIIRNLISNAIKFTPKGGLIEIGSKVNKPSEGLKPSEGYINIFLKDSGVGMNDDTLSKIFRIDENVTSLGTENEKGTGLGLILCKEFIEKHGGKIWVESELGKGSTFWFSLPLK